MPDSAVSGCAIKRTTSAAFDLKPTRSLSILDSKFQISNRQNLSCLVPLAAMAEGVRAGAHLGWSTPVRALGDSACVDRVRTRAGSGRRAEVRNQKPDAVICRQSTESSRPKTDNPTEDWRLCDSYPLPARYAGYAQHIRPGRNAPAKSGCLGRRRTVTPCIPLRPQGLVVSNSHTPEPF